MPFSLVEFGAKVGLFFVPFLFALCFHEFAHAYVAKLKGDRTAEIMGRLTLNPLAHIDWVGTVMLPLLALQTSFPFFGWAKPVPINEKNFRNPKNDCFWVAIAGPLSNILLAFVGWFLIVLVLTIFRNFQSALALFEMLKVFIQINLFLAFFNMLPLHPLDGGKVAARFLSAGANRWLEENQFALQMGLIVLFITGGFWFLAQPVYFVWERFIGTAVMMAQAIG